jgi:hypothetical protein
MLAHCGQQLRPQLRRARCKRRAVALSGRPQANPPPRGKWQQLVASGALRARCWRRGRSRLHGSAAQPKPPVLLRSRWLLGTASLQHRHRCVPRQQLCVRGRGHDRTQLPARRVPRQLRQDAMERPRPSQPQPELHGVERSLLPHGRRVAAGALLRHREPSSPELLGGLQLGSAGQAMACPAAVILQRQWKPAAVRPDAALRWAVGGRGVAGASARRIGRLGAGLLSCRSSGCWRATS